MITVPLAVMVSDTHSLPVMTNWLECFQHREKLIFGTGNSAQPVQFNSDRALVLILAALQVINREDMNEFLARAWRIVTGDGTTTDLMKMNVHACAFHFMRDVKKLAKKHYSSKDGIRLVMWSCSLIMNASCLGDMINVFSLLAKICLTKTMCKELEADVIKLNNCIYNFQILLREHDICIDTTDHDDNGLELKDREGTEEEMFNSASGSPLCRKFESELQRIDQSCKQQNEKCINAEVNPFYKPEFIKDLCKNLMPTAPLWSGLLLNDPTRHGNGDSYKDYSEGRIIPISHF